MCWGGFIRLCEETAISLRVSRPFIANYAPQAPRTTLPCGSAVMRLRDEHGSVDSQRFAALFSRLGQPVEALWPLAARSLSLTALLQLVKGPSNRGLSARAYRPRVHARSAIARPGL